MLASLVDRDGPVLVLRGLAAHGAEVDALQLLRELADLAVADRPAVHLVHRRDLRPTSTKEQLVTRVQLGPADAPLEPPQVKLPFDHLAHKLAGQALEDAIGP